MQKHIYVHYGSTFFDPSRNFPISNRRNWNKPFGGLWASRQDATFGWKDWCEQEEFRECDENNAFIFQLRDDSKIAIIHCMKDLDCLPTIGSDYSVFWNKVIDFEECVKQGYDAIELCWYGDEYKDKRTDDMYFGLYGWDCDSIIILNPSAVVPI